MFEVTGYQPPFIFVTSRRTGETYRLGIGSDGDLLSDSAPGESEEARRTALQYLHRKTRKPS